MSNDKLAQFIALCRENAGTYLLPGWDGHRVAQMLEAHEVEKQAGPVAEPVGAAGSMPGTSGFTMACFKASNVPVGTKLYTAPPSPLAEQDKEDAERWRELRRQHKEDAVYALTVFGPDDNEGLSPIGSLPGELDAAIDAARAKKEQPR